MKHTWFIVLIVTSFVLNGCMQSYQEEADAVYIEKTLSSISGERYTGTNIMETTAFYNKYATKTSFRPVNTAWLFCQFNNIDKYGLFPDKKVFNIKAYLLYSQITDITLDAVSLFLSGYYTENKDDGTLELEITDINEYVFSDGNTTSKRTFGDGRIDTTTIKNDNFNIQYSVDKIILNDGKNYFTLPVGGSKHDSIQVAVNTFVYPFERFPDLL